MFNSLLNMYNPKRLISVLALVSLFGLASPSAFATKSPEAVVQEAFSTLITNIEANRTTYRADSTALYSMVEQVLTPAINVESIANKILGKHARSVSSAQRAAFAEEFKKTLLYSYAALLLEYSGQKLVLKPSRVVGEDRVVVQTELVNESAGASIPINFYMSNRGEDRWRARNLEGAGINFVSTYRATYSQNIARNGIDSVIAELKAKNASLIK